MANHTWGAEIDAVDENGNPSRTHGERSLQPQRLIDRLKGLGSQQP